MVLNPWIHHFSLYFDLGGIAQILRQELQAAGMEAWEKKEKQVEEQLAGKEAEIVKLQKERQFLDCKGNRWL